MARGGVITKPAQGSLYKRVCRVFDLCACPKIATSAIVLGMYFKRSQTPIFVRALLWFIVGLLSASAIAQPSKFGEISDNPVIFGLPIVEPWVQFDDAGNTIGILPEFTKVLSQRSGKTYLNNLQPQSRLLHTFFRGEIDFAVLVDNPKLKAGSQRIAHLIDMDVVAISRPELANIDSIEKLAGLKVGLLRGVSYGQKISGSKDFTQVKVASSTQGLTMLLAGRIDTLAGSSHAIYSALNNVQPESSRISKIHTLAPGSAGLYISKQSKRRRLIPLYKKTVQAMQLDGSIKKIFDSKQKCRWEGNCTPPGTDTKPSVAVSNQTVTLQ